METWSWALIFSEVNRSFTVGFCRSRILLREFSLCVVKGKKNPYFCLTVLGPTHSSARSHEPSLTDSCFSSLDTSQNSANTLQLWHTTLPASPNPGANTHIQQTVQQFCELQSELQRTDYWPHQWNFFTREFNQGSLERRGVSSAPPWVATRVSLSYPRCPHLDWFRMAVPLPPYVPLALEVLHSCITIPDSFCVTANASQLTFRVKDIVLIWGWH